MWPFRRRPIAPEKQDWIAAHFDWEAARVGADTLRRTPLVTPTRHFFKAPRGEDDATAQAVFDEVKALLGLAGATVTLIAQGNLPDQAAIDRSQISAVSGTFQDDPDDPIITYEPRLLRTPVAFISTMAHELMHLRLAPFVDDLPGGEEQHELATDLHCIIAGFGILQMDAADSLGWAGYLQQDTRAHALAYFLHLTGHPVSDALPFLASLSAAKLRAAARHLDLDGPRTA